TNTHKLTSSTNSLVPLIFFFFQAEDGIRDLIVTGVQTCALPIFFVVRDGILSTPDLATGILPGITRDSIIQIAQDLGHTVVEKRSEERRVGKEWRCRGSGVQWGKKKQWGLERGESVVGWMLYIWQ